MSELEIWDNDEIQFPRLLAEIFAIGLDQHQKLLIRVSMNLESSQLDELFQRAEQRWETIKKNWLLLHDKNFPNKE